MEKKNSISKFREMRKESWSGIWGKRILSEISYLLEVSKAADNKYRDILDRVIDLLWKYVKENGAITKEIVFQVEEELTEMKEEARKYQVLLIGHAHIDMNWMWGFQETASVTVDTFETMLQLMEEYPQFTFAQSQASVYAIIEKYYPELLEKIKARIKEGRWEVSASTWVENDKNMSGSESMARHILYTKEYLSKLLEISVDTLTLDFEPDTFGHNENMPEILNQGGIKYYYHCRGYDKEHVYRWQAPSGAEVIVYREPVWYNATVLYDSLSYIPSFCKEYGLTTALKMYGVGDHGGGPTRRDIERWIEMQSWPLMPRIKFGTFAEFYRELEKVRENLPIVKQELNYIFTGCYTSQSRIKRANKQGEDRLFESEAMDVLAHIETDAYQTPSDYAEAWKKILFNQFHDILPGSGKVETREYAMGEFQKAIAASQINMNHAMRTICNNIDTSGLSEEEPEDWSFGAGAGFGTHDENGHMTGYIGRAGGKRRIITVFNPTIYRRIECVKVTLWDWNGNPDLLRVVDIDGNNIRCQVMDTGTHYWGHNYHTIIIEADVDAMGYTTYVLEEEEEDNLNLIWKKLSTSPCDDPRIDDYTDMPIVMENDKVKAVFSPNTMKMISLIDKGSGKESLCEPSAYFREVVESTQNEMTAWRIGNYITISDLNEEAPVRISKCEIGTLVRKIEYSISKENYTIYVVLSLADGNEFLNYNLRIEWHEIGNSEKGVPQLQFIVPFAYNAEKYACSIPLGVIEREGIAQDVPCTGFISGIPTNGSNRGLILMSDCKYGFRGYNNSVAVTLIRSSYDPDEMPEQGTHLIKLGLGITDVTSVAMTEKLERFVHPMYACSNGAHKGNLPARYSFMSVSGDVNVAAVKLSEDKKSIIIRIYNLQKLSTPVTINVNKNVIGEAYLTDILERKTQELQVEGTSVKFDIPAKSIRTVSLVLYK